MTIHLCVKETLVDHREHRIAVCGCDCGPRGHNLAGHNIATRISSNQFYSFNYFAVTCDACKDTDAYRNVVLEGQLTT